MLTRWRPDDGWRAWVIVTAAFLSLMVNCCVILSSGVFFVIFLHHIEGDRSFLALISATNYAMSMFAGVFVAPLINGFGNRTGQLIGGLVASGGFIATAFVRNPVLLFITFGLISGLGCGLAFLPTINVVNEHVVKRKAVAIAITIVGGGLGNFIGPPLIKALYDVYSYQGCMFLVAAFTLHILPLGAIYGPPKREQVNDAQKPTKKTVFAFLKIFKFNLFKNSTYDLLCLNSFLGFFSVSIVLVHLGAYAATLGHSERTSAMLYSGIGISNFVGRSLWAILELRIHFRAFTPYTSVFIMIGVFCLICPSFHHYYALMIFAVVFGGFFAVTCVTIPLVVIECLSSDELSSGFGYVLMFEALGQLSGAPVADLLYAYSSYYGASFYLAGGIFLLSGCILLKPCIGHTFCKSKHSYKQATKEVVDQDI